MSQLPAPRPPARRDGLAFTIVVTIVVAVCALPMAAIVGLSGAPGVLVLAVLLAAVPVGPLVACYAWLDRYEPEPTYLLALGLAWGACVATLAALLIGGIGGLLVPITQQASLAVVAPVTEEAGKGAFLLLVMWWRRHELDGVLDGIIYAGMVGLGFAFVENILYLAAAYNGTDGVGPGGAQAITATFVFRCLLSPFAHPLFTTCTGIGVGIAVSSRSRVVRFVAPVLGYAGAVVAHATWNSSTLFGPRGFLGVYLVLMLPALVFVMGLALWMRSREKNLLGAALTDLANRGLFPHSDIGWIVDLGARSRARAQAKQAGGKAGLEAMKAYQTAAIELGYLHHRYLRGTAPRDFPARGQHFVEQLRHIRPLLPLPSQWGVVR